MKEVALELSNMRKLLNIVMIGQQSQITQLKVQVKQLQKDISAGTSMRDATRDADDCEDVGNQASTSTATSLVGATSDSVQRAGTVEAEQSGGEGTDFSSGTSEYLKSGGGEKHFNIKLKSRE